MEEDALTRSKLYLKKIVNERLSTPPDEFVHPCLAGNYSLKPEEVKGEVCDWVLNYLEQSDCPHQLAVFIANKVANQISASVEERLSQNPDVREPYSTTKASSIHADALSCLHDLCCRYLEQPEEMVSYNQGRSLPFSSSVFAIKNKRRKMEDRHVVIHDLNTLLNLEKYPPMSYYAVFDGHAGIEAANFAAAHLHEDLAKHPDFLSDTEKAIKESYKLTDAHFCERAISEGIKSGCTVVTALIREQKLYLAWLGDSQAILVKQGQPITLMEPHKPNRPDEKQRIEELGGFVVLVGTWRVNGALAVARALGDYEFKPFVCSDPDVNVVNLDGTEDFLVLACDGLWDGMTPEEVTAALYRNIMDHPDEEDDITANNTLAEKLVHMSKVQGSDDNISVIVVLLRKLADIRANATTYISSTVHMNGKYVDYAFGDSTVQQHIEMSNAHDMGNFSQTHMAERPKNLQDLTSFPSLNADFSECSGSNSGHGLATSLPPEATALSELPTPPIDDIAPKKQFSELTVAEQMEELQSHLEATGFHGSSFGEYTSFVSENVQENVTQQMSEINLMDGDSLQQEVLVNDPNLNPQDFYATEVNSSTVFPATELSVREVTPEAVALDMASNIVTNTIESAMEQVELTADNAVPSEINGIPCSSLNPNAEPFVMKNFSPHNSAVEFDSTDFKLSDSTQPPVFPDSNPFSVSSISDESGILAKDSSCDVNFEKSSEPHAMGISNQDISMENIDLPATSLSSTTDVENSAVDFLGSNILKEDTVQQVEEPCSTASSNVEQLPEPLSPTVIPLAESLPEPSKNSVSQNDVIEVQDKNEQPPLLTENTDMQKHDVDAKSSSESMEQVQIEELEANVSKVELNTMEQDIKIQNVAAQEQIENSKQLISVNSEIDVKQNDPDICLSEEAGHNESVNSLIPDLESSIDENTSAGDVSQNILGTENVISPDVSKPVIGVDSLLPKEVQDELLKGSENPPSETVTEDSQTGAVAVDLKAVPDGVPEAEGVSEDIDSDSEKDGGWSYVKASEDVSTKKEELVDEKSGTVKVKKSIDKKSSPSPLLKAKKEIAKPGKTVSAPSKISSLSEKTKKPLAEKKVTEPKQISSTLKPSSTIAKQSVTSKVTKGPSSSINRNLPTKAPADTTSSTTKPLTMRPSAKPQAPVSKTLTRTTGSTTAKVMQKTTTSTMTSRSLVRPASAAAGSAQAKDQTATATTKASTQPRPPTRPTSAPMASKTNLTRPSKPTTTTVTENKPPVKKTTLESKKADVKEVKDNTNKQISARKATSTAVPSVPKSRFTTSTPKPNPSSNSNPKPLSQPRATKTIAQPPKTSLVEPVRHHIGLKVPKVAPTTNVNKSAKSKKDIGVSKKPSELTTKPKTKSNEEPKTEAKEKFTLEVNTKETKSEIVSNVVTSAEFVDSVVQEAEVEAKPNEVAADSVPTENAEVVL